MRKIKWLFCALASVLLLSCTAEVQDTVGLTDDYFKVSITPGDLTLSQDYEKCDALVVRSWWTKVTDWEDNPEVSYTLELAKAGTNFKNSYYASIGSTGNKIYTVKEFNQMLIKNGLAGNGEAVELEARIVATLDSYKGVRSNPVSFKVQTYYIDLNLLPPYDRIWFVGSFTGWKLVEMKRNPDNAFQFSIDMTFKDDSVNEFKFAVSNKPKEQWWDNYKAPYKDAPITETKVVQVHNDVVNDFKWKVVGEELGKSYHIVLDITPDEERMICTLLGDTPVEPDPGEDPGTDPGEDPGTDPGEDPGTDPGEDPGKDPGEDPTPVPAPDPGTASYVRKQFVKDMEYGCPGNEGSVVLESGWIKGLNAWRNSGYVMMTLDDVPQDGYYYLISGLSCWMSGEWSYKVLYGETADLQVFTPGALNALVEHRCVVYLTKGANSIRIKAGEVKYQQGWSPNFHYLIVSNGVTNGPAVGGNDQGEY